MICLTGQLALRRSQEYVEIGRRSETERDAVRILTFPPGKRAKRADVVYAHASISQAINVGQEFDNVQMSAITCQLILVGSP